jgi:hypothetical protein
MLMASPLRVLFKASDLAFHAHIANIGMLCKLRTILGGLPPDFAVFFGQGGLTARPAKFIRRGALARDERV